MAQPISPDPADTSSITDPEMVASALPALGWARVLLVVKEHGILAALCLMMAYQIGAISQAQAYMCGV